MNGLQRERSVSDAVAAHHDLGLEGLEETPGAEAVWICRLG